MNWLLSSSLLFYWLPNIFRIRGKFLKLLDHLQCLFLENLWGRMQNKLACKRDCEHNEHNAQQLGSWAKWAKRGQKRAKRAKWAKRETTIVSHYALAALHSGDKVTLLVGLQKWHAVQAKFCCNVCLPQGDFHGSWNLLLYLEFWSCRVQPFEQAVWKLLRSHRPGFSCNLSYITLTVKLGKLLVLRTSTSQWIFGGRRDCLKSIKL